MIWYHEIMYLGHVITCDNSASVLPEVCTSIPKLN